MHACATLIYSLLMQHESKVGPANRNTKIFKHQKLVRNLLFFFFFKLLETRFSVNFLYILKSTKNKLNYLKIQLKIVKVK